MAKRPKKPRKPQGATLLDKHMPFPQYMEIAKRDDSQTICVYVQTPTAWVLTEVPRAALPQVRDTYQEVVTMLRDQATTPEGAGMLLPGETFAEAKDELVRSYVYDAMADGLFAEAEVKAPLMACAYYLGERWMTERMLTPDQISGVEIRLKTEGEALLHAVAFWLRPTAAEGERYLQIMDEAHRRH